MFIIKNSYISHCGKKSPVAHCDSGITATEYRDPLTTAAAAPVTIATRLGKNMWPAVREALLG